MRVFLMLFGVLAFGLGVLLFISDLSAPIAVEIVPAILMLIGTVAFGTSEIIAAIDKLRDDTVRLHDIERLERAQRALAQKAR